MTQEWKQPKVSVCVVTFNQEKYIKDCIVSALAQRSDAGIEILVGDDASTDKTGEIAQSLADAYPDIIRYFRHPTNLGCYKNYQFLIERATGDFIAHLDGDDFWLPGKLETQLRFMEHHPECPAVYTNAAVVDKNKTPIGVFNNKQPEIQDIHYYLRYGNYLVHSSLLYRAHLKDRVLSFDRTWLDFSAHCRFVMTGPLGYANGAYVAYRLGAEKSWGDMRQIRWEMLMEVKRDALNSQASLKGFCSFWGSILCGSFRRGGLANVLRYGKRIRQEIGPWSGRIFSIGAIYSINIAYRVLRDNVLGMFSGKSNRVYCRR